MFNAPKGYDMESATIPSASTLAHWEKEGGGSTFHSNPARNAAAQGKGATPPPNFPPLELELRPAVGTAAAAYYLDRRPQTLRSWASQEVGPLRAIRVHCRLAWPVASIKKLLGVPQ